MNLYLEITFLLYDGKSSTMTLLIMLSTCKVSASSFNFHLLVLHYDVVYKKSKRSFPQPLLIYKNALIKFAHELRTSIFSITQKWISKIETGSKFYWQGQSLVEIRRSWNKKHTFEKET